MHTYDYDVIVVGAGPSGLTTALSIARHGATVLVVERHSAPSSFPKATGLRPRTMEIFRSWGLEPAIRAVSQPTRLCMSVAPVLSVPGEELSMGLPTEAELAPVSPTSIAVCPQDRLEIILADALRESGGSIRFGTRLTDLHQDDHGVCATVETEGRAA